MNMKYKLIILFLLIFRILSAEVIKVGAYENAPKIFTDESGKISGFWADITNIIAEKEGWEIEWVHGTWDECLERLEKNEIDIMVDTGWNEERSKKYLFTQETVLLSWSTVYVQDTFDFQSINDLRGKKIGVLRNSINYTGQEGLKSLLERFEIECEFIEFSSYDDIFKAIVNKIVDAGVTNKHFGDQHENNLIKKTSFDFLPSKLLYSLPVNSLKAAALIEKLDTRIRELKSNDKSFYFHSLDRWYGKQTDKKYYIPLWVYWGLALLLSAVISLYILNKILSKLVERKTKELETAYAEMEKKVEDRTFELSQANIKLKELDHLKSMFIASMSHELRTPLNSIIGFTGLILQGISGKIDDDAKEDLEIVYNSSKHLLSLINDVIDISKIEADKFEIYFEEFSLNEVLNDVITIVAKDAQKKDLEIRTQIPDSLRVKSDRKRLFQCVLNLMSNAVKYSEKGYVELKVEKTDNSLRIAVKDTGIGIREEDISKLFKSFIRLESHIKELTLGTGLVFI
jgi:signal transduction histidine kinase